MLVENHKILIGYIIFLPIVYMTLNIGSVTTLSQSMSKLNLTSPPSTNENRDADLQPNSNQDFFNTIDEETLIMTSDAWNAGYSSHTANSEIQASGLGRPFNCFSINDTIACRVSGPLKVRSIGSDTKSRIYTLKDKSERGICYAGKRGAFCEISRF